MTEAEPPAGIDALARAAESIRREADALLRSHRLWELLREYGRPFAVGSYALDLMVWRDLDLTLEAPDLAVDRFFELGTRLTTTLCPVKMSFRNERIARTPELPAGLYWGIYLGDERAGAWKIDLWAVDSAEAAKAEERRESLRARLTPEARSRILSIKSRIWQDPEYRRSMTSSDVYSAVLDSDVRTLEQFEAYLRDRSGQP